MNEVLLKAEGIYKSFGATKAVVDFHIEVCRGTIHGLIGENGSGKSTFSSIVAGIQQRDSGRLLLRGEDYAPTSSVDAAKQGVSLIVQEIGTIGSIPVSANIFLNEERRFVKHGCIDYNTMNAEAKKILSQIGGEHIDPQAITGTLNLEDRKLVEIARGMYSEPELLIIDETSNALAKHGRDILYQNMRAVRDRGGAVIFITHDLAELIDICDCVTVMRDGHYIETLFKEQMEESRLKSLMVGRELDSFYTKNKHKIGEVALETKNLSHVKLFKDASFKARYGEIVGFAGLVGAGRTELMKTIFGAYEKSGGEILLDGKPVNIKSPSDAIRNGIAYVSEDRRGEGLILKNDVRFNMGLVCLADFVSGIHVKDKEWGHMVEDYRKKFSIKITSPKQLAGNLSGGNQQKVVLSKWLASKPKVIILDEPTRGIDVAAKAEIYAIIDELAANGACIIMVSSELPEIINMCNRCYVMCEGMITGEINETEFSQEAMMTLATKRD